MPLFTIVEQSEPMFGKAVDGAMIQMSVRAVDLKDALIKMIELEYGVKLPVLPHSPSSGDELK